MTLASSACAVEYFHDQVFAVILLVTQQLRAKQLDPSAAFLLTDMLSLNAVSCGGDI